MFKKLASVVCVVAMAITTLATTTFAATTNLGVSNGPTAYNESKKETTVTLNCSELVGKYAAGGTIKFFVTKGAFKNSSLSPKAVFDEGYLGVYEDGEYAGGPSFNQNLYAASTDEDAKLQNDQYDILAVTFAGDSGLSTADGNICYVKIRYNSDAADVDIIPASINIELSDAEGTVNSTLKEYFENPEYKYVLKAGTNEVVKTKIATEPTEKHVDVAVKTAKGEDVNLGTPNYKYSDTNGDVAVAFMATVTPNDDTVNGIKWTVKSGDVEKPFAKVFDGTITGATAVSYGLIIKGIDTVQSVNAAATVVE